jgi:hypothetical protein
MAKTLIPATELAEYVYCSKAWQLKFVQGAESSREARELQAKGNEWHVAQGRALARGDSYRWAAYASLALAVILFLFSWLGWTR